MFTIRRRIAGTILITLVSWLAILLTGGTMAVDDLLVFRTDVSGTVHVPGFYPPAQDDQDLHGKNNQLRFKGGTTIRGEALGTFPFKDANLSASFGTRTGTLYRYEFAADGPVCARYEDLCHPKTDATYGLFIKRNDGEDVLTTSYAVLERNFTALHALDHLIAEPSPDQSLVLMPKDLEGLDRHLNHYEDHRYVFMVRPDETGTASFDLTPLTYADTAFLPYVLAAGLCLAAAFWFASGPAFRNFLKTLWEGNRPFVIVLTGWALVCYLAVFPGNFTSDTLLGNANAAAFWDWYGTLYYLYTAVFRVLGYWFIQLPPMLVFLFSFFIVLRIIDLADFDAARLPAHKVKWLFIACVLLSPGIVAAMLVPQRYFLAAAVFTLAVALAAFTWVKEQRAAPTQSASKALMPYLPALALMGLAALFRAEYFVFFLAALAAFGFLIMNAKTERRKGIIIVATCLLALGNAWAVTAKLIPLLHKDYPVELFQARYKAVSVLSMGEYNVCVKGTGKEPRTADETKKTDRIALYLESLGGKRAYCDEGAEAFWWNHAYRKAEDLGPDGLNDLSALILERIAADPMHYVRHRWHVAKDIFTTPYWHLIGRYSRRDWTRETGETLPWHEYHADRFALLPDAPLQGLLNTAVTSFYIILSVIGGVWVSTLWVLIAGAALTVLARTALTGAFSLLVLGLSVPVVMMAPAATWAYLIFIPIWAAFVVPLGLVEARMRSAGPSA